MNEVMASHRQAMEYAEKAFCSKLKGDHTKTKEFFLLAFELERKAAELMKDSTLEPTRSVLYRSAATLACDCDNLREAKRLAYIGLSGNPPGKIAEELRDLLKDIHHKETISQRQKSVTVHRQTNHPKYIKQKAHRQQNLLSNAGSSNSVKASTTDLMVLDEIKETISSNREVLKDRFKVSTIGIFGSYVRAEQKKRSDIDILVEFDGTVGLIEFMQLEFYLKDLLGIKVDLVTKDALKPYIGKHILDEVVYI
jgi:hypothetical protein